MSRLEEINERLKANEGQFHKDKISLDDDVHYLLSKLEAAETALEYYAELYRNLYSNIQEGELIMEWLQRQGAVAIEALQQIRE